MCVLLLAVLVFIRSTLQAVDRQSAGVSGCTLCMVRQHKFVQRSLRRTEMHTWAQCSWQGFRCVVLILKSIMERRGRCYDGVLTTRPRRMLCWRLMAHLMAARNPSSCICSCSVCGLDAALWPLFVETYSPNKHWFDGCKVWRAVRESLVRLLQSVACCARLSAVRSQPATKRAERAAHRATR